MVGLDEGPKVLEGFRSFYKQLKKLMFNLTWLKIKH